MATLDEFEEFTIRPRHEGGVDVIEVEGELDLSTAGQLDEAIEEAGVAARVLLDFEACGFIDSSGLRVVVSHARKLRAAGGELAVTNLRGEVAKIFALTGLLVDGSAVVQRG
jgi:stage II sporulation protein AA (anti-sigma F factor antagonist)